MNTTNSSQQNHFFLTKQQWFEIIGSSLTIDNLILYLATPFSLAGVLLNSISYYVLSSKKFESKVIFSQLRVYCLNSLLISLFLSTYFNITYNYFEVTNSFGFRAYTTKVYIPILTILDFFNGFLDILISLERLLDFFPGARKINSLKSCFVLMFVVVLITIPYFFVYSPAYFDVNLSETETFRLYCIGLSNFGQSLIGQVVNNVLFFIKDIVAFTIEVVLNMILIFLLRKHINKKTAIIHMASNPINSLQSPTTQESSLSRAGVSESRAEIIVFRSNNSSPRKLAKKRSKNITVMVVVICLFSGLAHLTSITCNFLSLLLITENYLMFGFCFGSNFFLSFKSFLNFFIFFLFNNLFCVEFKKLVGFKKE